VKLDEQPVLLGPGEGETTTDRPERSIQILCEFPQIIVSRFRYEPGEEGPDPHVHHQHADAFYVLEGEVEFLLDGEWHRVGPGTFLSVPPNVEHGFRPCGSSFRLLNFHTPNVGFIRRLREG